MIDCALKDSFFAPIVHDLIDYGHEITFPVFGGAGAYQPHAITTEALDTPEKQLMFTHGFAAEAEAGTFRAKIKLTSWFGRGGNAHSFLHELMHFYQDTLGLLLMPLKEQGKMPIMADLRTSVVALLFCEAWAEVEALRSCWAFKHKKIDDAPWKGALASPDWGDLAKFYAQRLAENRGEAHAAARTFEQWYKGKHRDYYEVHALEKHQSDFDRLSADVDLPSLRAEGEAIHKKDLCGGRVDCRVAHAPRNDDRDGAIKDHFRSARIEGLLKKIPKDTVPEYFDLIDWGNAALNEPKNDIVLGRCKEFEDRYGVIENDALLDIKCASPPYLWKRLSEADAEASEVPPQTSMGEFEYKGQED